MRRVNEEGKISHKHPLCAVLRLWLKRNPGWHGRTQLEQVGRERFETPTLRTIDHAQQRQRAVPAEPATAALRRLESPRRRLKRELNGPQAQLDVQRAQQERQRVLGWSQGAWDLAITEALAALHAQGTIEPDGLGRWRHVADQTQGG